jgi:hypothetical protein
MPVYIPYKQLKKRIYEKKIRTSICSVVRGDYKMVADIQKEFLNEFDKFYQSLVRDVKEEKLNEADFYMIIKAKAKAMDRERREKVEIKVKYTE